MILAPELTMSAKWIWKVLMFYFGEGKKLYTSLDYYKYYTKYSIPNFQKLLNYFVIYFYYVSRILRNICYYDHVSLLSEYRNAILNLFNKVFS